MNHKIDLQPAYVLHTRDYRDTSMLVDLLTLDFGIVRAVARGVRPSSAGARRSNRRALLQALQPLLVTLRGKGDLMTLSQIEASATAFSLQGNRLFSVMYMNELLCRLLHAHESHPQIYRLYQAALLSLMHDCVIESVLRRFEFQLLMELGYAPDMQHDADSSAALQPGQSYEFDYLRGFVVSSAHSLKNSAACYEGSDILQMGNLLIQNTDAEFPVSLSNTAKRFMRQAMRPHLGPKPLNSRRLFSLPTPRPQ